MAQKRPGKQFLLKEGKNFTTTAKRPNIDFPREEGLDAQHGYHIQQNQLHVNAVGDHHKSTDQTEKKDKKKTTLFTMAPLNNMHKGHC